MPAQTYNVIMQDIVNGRMIFGESKEKSAIINALTDENFPVDSDNKFRDVIGNIDWCLGKAGRKGKQRKREPRTVSLRVKFLWPEPGNEALANGLYWQGRHHPCFMSDATYILPRCKNCQYYGHFTDGCSAEPQCGLCAEQHQTNQCPSNPNRYSIQSGVSGDIKDVMCVLCGGPHVAADRDCPVRKQRKNTHRFPTGTLPSAPESTQVLAANKIEPNQHKLISGRSQDDHSVPKTQPQPIEGLKILGAARNAGSRQDASHEHKRVVEDGLPVTASDREVKRVNKEYLVEQESWYREHSRVLHQQDEEASPDAGSYGGYNFIKKEEESPKKGLVYREDSMAHYRQPSPYIVHRSE